jgi:hypothetical protein
MIIKCNHLAEQLSEAGSLSNTDICKFIVLISLKVIQSCQCKDGIGLPSLPWLLNILWKISLGLIKLEDETLKWKEEAQKALGWFHGFYPLHTAVLKDRG